jgi:excinuclease ABC subunit A
MAKKVIKVVGAREHNLKNINIDIPRNKFVVITGISGSGKSSLAFDTIYAEGQRKYVESLSAYARQFLEQMQKPDVEHIEGLPPTIAIEQRKGSSNPRSTVATSTEIYDYCRVLYARAGIPHCWICGREVTGQSASQIIDSILQFPEGTRVQICAPIVRGAKGEHRDVLTMIQREGWTRARIDGVVGEIKNAPALDKNKKHDIYAVIDRLVIKEGIRGRLGDSVESALKMGDGNVTIMKQLPAEARPRDEKGDWEDVVYSEKFACIDHPQASLEELSPRLFSFNSPYGACPECHGLGTILEFDPELIVPDTSLSLENGAVSAWRKGGKRMNILYSRMINNFCVDFGVSKAIPFEKIPAKIKKILLYGTEPADEAKYGCSFEGVIPNLDRRWKNTDSEFVKHRLHSFLSEQPCKKCGGKRLRPEALAVTVAGLAIDELCAMSIEKAYDFFMNITFDKEREVIAEQPLKEIRARLKFMLDSGLGYITLDRASATLSGGEAQRIRLATQVGSGLVGCCYVLDEPTIGLHRRDNDRLIGILRKLTNIGNSVLVVEHDEDVIRESDHLIDIGPAAGAHGGELVAQGTLKQICDCKRSITGNYLSGRSVIELPAARRKVNMQNCIEVKQASQNNLKNINVKFPLEVFTCVTGVSGSGKSTLVTQILLKSLKKKIYGSRETPGKHKSVTGSTRIDKIIEIDQSPIGRTPRSNPATYTGIFDQIRQLFAKTREAKVRGYKPGRFSFNVKGGRCESCQGHGTKKIEMHFLPDVYVTCEHCKGTRYNPETLQITYKSKNIAEVLDMRIQEALRFFANVPRIYRMLLCLANVGLGYMTLGQASTTLSGGEAQRVKLATELGKPSSGRTLYILDEPTTGLHFADIHKLLDVLGMLVDKGNSVLVIEHNLDVIKMADYIIDLGPEGGDRGGEVVECGSPEKLARSKNSYTGQYLREYLS